ncbi:MAG: metallophosphoesterase family protein [Phycisphaerales bacterium]|nr:MAG: metallophosphoesterase family protein [Phycisphaerales bacterium]
MTPLENPLAVISDVHGNRWALEVVLEDIQRRGIRNVVNLGDSLYGPLDPAGTAQILIGLDIPSVRGNEDRIIVEPENGLEPSPTLRYVKDALDPRHLQWLSSLPLTRTAHADYCLCHGTLARDDEYFLEDVQEAGVSLKTSNRLMAQMESAQQSVLLCGHSHAPRTVYLPDGKLIVNPGSVGLSAYTDDAPLPHAMEVGSPHARYAVVSRCEVGWNVEHIALSYDWQSAAATAQANGRPDWARWLQTGRASLD